MQSLVLVNCTVDQLLLELESLDHEPIEWKGIITVFILCFNSMIITTRAVAKVEHFKWIFVTICGND